MPAWIRRIKDTAVRNLVEQEYYIDPDLAEKYAEIGTVEGIQAMRRKRWDWGGLYE
jgi:hypothetical protein